MPKKSKQKLVLIKVFLTLLMISSTYATLMPSANAEVTTQQKTLAITNDVVGVNLAKCVVASKEYPQE